VKIYHFVMEGGHPPLGFHEPRLGYDGPLRFFRPMFPRVMLMTKEL
jgi:hypothetical protein